MGFRDSVGAIRGVVFVHLDDAGQLAFGASEEGKRTPPGEPLSVDLRRVHELVIKARPTGDPAFQRIEVRLDGVIAWDHEIHWPAAGVASVVGRNIAEEPGCAAVFSGSIHSVQRAPDGRDPLQAAKGDTLKLRVRFPVGQKGAREPLLVTGQTGVGDFLTVEYIDERTIRFAVDHWGGPLLMSEPVAIDLAAPHDIAIATSALWGATEDIPLRMARKGAVRIELDGVAIWRAAPPSYAARPDEIAIGYNPIGGTSAAARFTGDILSAERAAR
jgi:hypothetical protein